jgi:hypothetical protein
LRALRVAPAQQQLLPWGGQDGADDSEQLWWSGLPEPVRVEVLRLLARMIARGVLVEVTVEVVVDGEPVVGLR